jgi:hypothetical protein
LTRGIVTLSAQAMGIPRPAGLRDDNNFSEEKNSIVPSKEREELHLYPIV